jgi:hypothetical protein
MACAKARCSVCRRRFTADRRTATRQTMCSRACRVRRRGAQAKARRGADLESYQAAERERQRDSRRRRGEAAPREPEEVEKSAPSCELSRAELAAQVRAITSVIVENVDKAAAVSRAEFGRQVAKIVKECVHNLGRACA